MKLFRGKKRNAIKLSLTLGLLVMGAALSARADQTLQKSACTVERLDPLVHPAIDAYARVLAFFNCSEPIGATEPRHQASAFLPEHDYANIQRIYQTQQSVVFEFNGTYAGELVSYNGITADWTPFKQVRTGIERNGNYTTLTFRDIPQAVNKKILAAVQEVGALNINEGNISVSLSAPETDVGELKLTVQTMDVSELILATSPSIYFADGQKMMTDQVEFSGQSAFLIQDLLIKAGMAVNQGHSHKPGHYASFWDYVYLDKDGVDPLFHCANFHSGPEYSKCYFTGLRLK